MDLWEIRMEIPPAAAESTEQLLLETGNGAWSLLEDAIAKRAWVVGVFATAEEAGQSTTELLATLPAGVAAPVPPRHLPDSDWKHSYRVHFKPWAFGRLHWVPVWERETYPLPPGHAVLWLDPGMAFGTGNHETTRLCIERLVEYERGLQPGDAAQLSVLDAGCGSGILALSAYLLGFRTVLGFDNDAEAVRVSLENAALNHLDGKVRFQTAGLPAGLGSGDTDVVLANIQSDILVRFAEALAGAVAPGGMLAMSGILATEAQVVQAAFAPLTGGWSLDSRALGEWCDVCLRRPL
jgi:ribosomal protein L11 methyltransferase